jgi:hypothetical protein
MQLGRYLSVIIQPLVTVLLLLMMVGVVGGRGVSHGKIKAINTE